MRKILVLCYVIILFGVICGCQNGVQEQNSLPDNKQNQPISQHLANDVEQEIIKMNEVDKVRAVSLEKDVYIALTVTGFDRFFLQEIRQNAHKRAKNIEQKGKIHVSTDKKLDMEIAKIEKQIMENEISKEELEKKLKKLDDDMKG